LYIIEYNESTGLAPRGAERIDPMPEIGLIRYASGDWTPGSPYVRVRIETDELEEPQDLSIALGEVGALVTLLLALRGKAGTGGCFGPLPLIPWGWPRPRPVKPFCSLASAR
jgi:hypothetical protein